MATALLGLLARAVLAAGIFFTPSPQPQFLQFTLCNGLANQELGILAAVALALEHGVGLVLPTLVANGRQNLTQTLAPTLSGEGNAPLEFESVFDAPRFVAAAAAHGVRIISSKEAAVAQGAATTAYALARDASGDEWAAWRASGAPIALQSGCALGSASPDLIQRHRAAIEGVLSALAPAAAIATYVALVQATLRAERESGHAAFLPYDAVHLRYERDWSPLCEFWRNRPLSPDVRNCGLLSAEELIRRLEAVGVGSAGAPVFVAVEEGALDDPSLLVALRSRFRIVTRREVAGIPQDLPREVGALVDLHVSLGAARWSGNSFSTFSGLIILARQLQQLAPVQPTDKLLYSTNVTTWYNVSCMSPTTVNVARGWLLCAPFHPSLSPFLTTRCRAKTRTLFYLILCHSFAPRGRSCSLQFCPEVARMLSALLFGAHYTRLVFSPTLLSALVAALHP